MNDNRYKKILIKIAVVSVTLIVSFIVAEICFRIVLFSDISIFKNNALVQKQKNSMCYADPNSQDDYWLLQYHLIGERECEGNKDKAHPLLGWTGWKKLISEDNLIHKNFNSIGNRRPVLLYGDSVTTCVGSQTCFEHILDSDEEFSKGHYLLNYGVGGYGLDQIYLLLKNSINHYKNPFVVIGISAYDMDRSILSVRQGQKPFFRVENGTLKLDDQPILSDPNEFYSTRKPQIKSYLYRRIIRSLFVKKHFPEKLVSFLKRDDYYKRKKIKVNEKIILEIIKEIKDRKLDHLFIFFLKCDPQKDCNEKIDWKTTFERNLLEENTMSYISTRGIIKQKSEGTNLTVDDFYLHNDSHPNMYLNKLVAEEIKSFVMKAK
jgi:hypothetical protein